MSEQVHVGTIDGRVTSLEIRMAVAEADLKSVRADISSIKDDTKWLRRTITGALITAAIGGVIGIAFVVIEIVMKGGAVG